MFQARCVRDIEKLEQDGEKFKLIAQNPNTRQYFLDQVAKEF